MKDINDKKEENKQPAVTKKSDSARFTDAVMKQFQSDVGTIKLTSFQKKLIQNYFIKLDGTLKDAEIKRLKKSEQYRDLVPVTWENVNMNKLALEVVALSSVGLDPLQPNHINLMPFKNNANNNYDIVVIIGYRGLELKATKYGINVPNDVIVELVYENDSFSPIKKNATNKVENYSFDIEKAFNRGELIGGFYYHVFYDRPEKNKLVIFNKQAIEKRKPKYASAEFWGGEKDVWKDGKKTGKKEKIEGWYDEMAYKTICRAAYNSITIDSEKIDNHFVTVMELESNYNQLPESKTQDVEHVVVKETATEEIAFKTIPNQQPKQAKIELNDKAEPNFTPDKS